MATLIIHPSTYNRLVSSGNSILTEYLTPDNLSLNPFSGMIMVGVPDKLYDMLNANVDSITPSIDIVVQLMTRDGSFKTH